MARFFYGTTRLAESGFVAKQVAERIRLGTPEKRIAILSRSNFLVEPVLDALKKAGIPIRLRPHSGFTLAEQKALAVLEFLREWEEEGPLSPRGARTLCQVFGMKQEALRQLEARSLRDESFHPGDELTDPRWISLLEIREKRLHPARLVQEVGRIFAWDLSGQVALHELAANTRTLSQLLRRARQGLRPVQESSDGVLVTTFHGSKGLEFEIVFVVACEDGIIPDRRSTGSACEMQQERRALYVAITRASQEVVITCARDRHRGSPSRFLPGRRSPLWTEARWGKAGGEGAGTRRRGGEHNPRHGGEHSPRHGEPSRPQGSSFK
jgi:superfamily I DNA/RNA helicase